MSSDVKPWVHVNSLVEADKVEETEEENAQIIFLGALARGKL